MSEHDLQPPDSSPKSFDDAVVGFLADLVKDMGSTLELDQLLLHVANGVKRFVDYDTFAVLLLEDLGQELYFHFALGYSDDVVKRWYLPETAWNERTR